MRPSDTTASMTWISPAISIAAVVVVLVSPAVAAPNTVTWRSNAPPGPLTVPCDHIPQTAVKKVPAPLDRYARLVCTHAGQALEPLTATHGCSSRVR